MGYTDIEGLTFIGEVEWCNESYEFDVTGVWVDKRERAFYYYDDSGCSCPAPYEDISGRADLTRATKRQILKHLSDRRASAYSSQAGLSLSERIMNKTFAQVTNEPPTDE